MQKKRKHCIFLMPSGNRHNNGFLIESLNLMKEMMLHDRYKLSSSLTYGLNFHVPLTDFFECNDMDSISKFIDTMVCHYMPQCLDD